MRLVTVLALSLILALSNVCLGQKQTFNSDSAFAYTRHLSQTIGPRVMGSPAEQKALQWVAARFRNFGADTAYVMPVPRSKMGVNTSSGVAVGIFPGRSDSAIVIGGHIDSSHPENPGANDNASGTACMMELARIWANQPRRYTLVFCAFGGEERGLIGSRYFVEHYPNLDKVALMLQIDMAGSSGWLIPFIDTKKHQAPRWLVEDSYTIDRVLGYNSLQYPTHFFSINAATGGAGSDHLPFLEKKIPAIDFTAGINTSPIHTPQDRLELVSAAMLARSGRLVDGLISRYQEQGIPTERVGHYMLWEVLGGRLFIPYWLVLAVVILAIGLAVLAFLRSRRVSRNSPEAPKGRLSVLKLLLFMLIIALFCQLGEAAMQLLKGLRYPWYAQFEKYMWFAALWSAAGLWLSLQLTRRWRFSRNPHVYARTGLFLLVIFTLLLLMASARLALYPAITLLLLSLAIFLPRSPLTLLLVLLAPIPMWRLVFMETLPFLAQSLTAVGMQIHSLLAAAIYTAGLTAFLTLWFFPAMMSLAYGVVRLPQAISGIKLARHPVVGAVLLFAIVGYGGYLYAFPAYTEEWRALLKVQGEYRPSTEKSELKLIGNEFLRGVSVKSDTLNRTIDIAENEFKLPLKFKADWMSVQGSQMLTHGERDTVQILWNISATKPWHKVELRLGADTLDLEVVKIDQNYEKSKTGVQSIWFSDPPDTVSFSARVAVNPGARLIRKVHATFVQPPLPVQVASRYADVLYRTVVIREDTLTILPADTSTATP